MKYSLAAYLGVGSWALEQVRVAMRYGAGNKVGDIVSSLGQSISCVDELQKGAPWHYGHVDGLRRAADKAAELGCGNCSEQAAVAFIRLHDLGVLPLDFMSTGTFDHAFVVLGRESATNEKSLKHAEWGSNAVICDPWDGKVYPATQVFSTMWKISPTKGFWSYCRVDGHEP